MIQIESLYIKEFRGIRELTLDMKRQSFVISGPNGSGKSGVVDAIEFGLTGEITRLTGRGTRDLKLATHGPHVDKRDRPDLSFVRLDVRIPKLNRVVTLTRNVKKPKQVTIEPNDDDVRTVLLEVAKHPEITLSRREIIKFILTEATQRSRDVQTLLKLDEIDQTRSALKTTQNRLESSHVSALSKVTTAKNALVRHFDIPDFSTKNILSAVNERRRLLELEALELIDKDTQVAEGISKGDRKPVTVVSKESALRDITAAYDAVAVGLGETSKPHVDKALEYLNEIKQDPALLEAIKRRSFIQQGLELAEGSHCPLCDTDWDVDALRAHLEEKLQRAKNAEEIQERLLGCGREIAQEVTRIHGLIEPVGKISITEGMTTLADALDDWAADLTEFSRKLLSVQDLIGVRRRLATSWTGEPSTVLADLAGLADRVRARPDESATMDAKTFLVVAQERLAALYSAKEQEEVARASMEAGRATYRTYCEVAESALTSLYEAVEIDFSAFYRAINHEDEGEFEAKLEPADGGLDLSVDFYKRGMFPPGAYHSEGHQDGMGVCLYLALMKHILGNNFTFAVLDDVVMSVDSQHRKQFCKLLRTHFPDTQFVITTHDEVWARQMRGEGLVNAKSAMTFQGWNVETGPIAALADIWSGIDADLEKGDIASGAAKLRRYLEYVSSELADQLAAEVTYRADGGYDLGDLLPKVLKRQKELLGKAAAAAQAWNDGPTKQQVQELKTARSELAAASGVEQWAVNKAVHYTQWANFSKPDFVPVVEAFKGLLGTLWCDKCDGWLYVVPRKAEPEVLRCNCSAVSLNLKGK